VKVATAGIGAFLAKTVNRLLLKVFSMRVLVVTAMYSDFVKEQVDSLREAGVEIDVFAFESKGSARNYLKAGLTLRHILRKKSYDLVHAHYGLSGAVAIMQQRCPVVITFHGSDLLGTVNSQNRYTRGGKVRTIISKCAALSAAQCIVVAEHLKAKLWHKSAVTIPMGVDLALFKPIPPYEARRQLGLAHNKQLILFAAHPRNQSKRFDIAQEAVSLLQEDNLDIELLPVYNKPHHEVPLYMNACDVLVFPSMYEGSPCVIKEAMACNLPIVSTDVGDVAVRMEGVQGCYLCEYDPHDVADKLRQALKNGRCSNGRSKIAELSVQNIAARVMDVYSQVHQAHAMHG
jgi:teichuronic acid biosynthesis glycosyltransferase TuaC